MSLLQQLDLYDTDRLTLFRDLGSLDPAQLRRRPRPDQWSLLESAEQLALAEHVV
jgi:hypothetical protein